MDKETVTTFVADSNITNSDLVGSTDAVAQKYLPESENNDLIKLLKRPVAIAAGEWNTNDIVPSFTPSDMSQTGAILSLDLPETLFAANKLIREKLNNFTYFHASLCFHLLVNGPPFLSGKLMAIWRPFSVEQQERELAKNHLTGLSAYQRMEIDVSAGNSARMKVPYVASEAAWELVSTAANAFSLGTFEMYVLNTLKTAIVPTTATYTLYAYFDDVVITFPTPVESAIPTPAMMHVVKKNGTLRSTTKAKAKLDLKLREKKTPMNLNLPDVIPARPKRATSDFHIDRLGYDVPDTLRMLPRAQVGGDIFQNNPAYRYTNDDSLSNSVSMSLSSGESIPRQDMGQKIDALDISHLVKRESILASFNWATTGVAEDLLFRAHVDPTACQTAGGVFFPTMLAYVSTFFKFWNGSIKYRFSAAKTAYHSGRIRISFIPAITSSFLPLSMDLDNAYNFIWDLRTSNEFECECPFVSNVPMLRIGNLNDFAPSSGNTHNASGLLLVTVMNPLVASETVADNVDINVWVSSSDMRYAVQSSIPFKTTVVLPVPKTSDYEKRYKDVALRPVAQVLGEELPDIHNETEKVISIMPVSTVAIDSVTSEHITSFRSLLHRFTPCFSGLVSDLTVWPNYFNLPDVTLPYSVLDRLSYLYVFNRGSQHFKLVTWNHGTLVEPLMYVSNHPIFDQAAEPSSGVGVSIEDISTVNITKLNPIVDVKLPYYSARTQRVNNAPSAEQLSSRLQYNTLPPNPSQCVVLRAGGADFDFGTIIGPPAISYSLT
jgi:hypothetical protein